MKTIPPRYILPAFLVTAVLLLVLQWLGFQYFNRRVLSSRLTQPTIENSVLNISLPSGWQRTQDATDGVVYKAEKQNTNGKKDTIVAIQTQTSYSDHVAYTNNLIKGTKSTIPTFQTTSDVVFKQTNPIFTREIKGYFMNNDEKNYIIQRFVINGNTVLTLTYSSFTAPTFTSTAEVEKIFEDLSN